jgi:anti-sigma B factor antagonist
MVSNSDTGPAMTVRIEPADGSARTLHVVGEIDLATAPALEQAVADAADGAEQVAVDLGGVRFIDSTGLRVLLSSQQRADADGVEVRVVEASEVARRLFDLTGTTARLFGT